MELNELKEKIKNILKQGEKIFHKTQDQYRKKFEEKAKSEILEYWQGRKDGVRVLLTLFHEEFGNVQDANFWENYNISSDGFRLTDEEIYIETMKSTVSYIADLLWTIESKKLTREFHPLTLGNAKTLYYSLKSKLKKMGHEVNDVLG